MTCAAAKELIESYLDGELDATLGAQVREHVADCAACAAKQTELAELRAAIQAQAPYHRAPAELHDQVRFALRQSSAGRSNSWRWAALAASLLLAVSLAWNIAQWRTRGQPDVIADNVVASHVRALMGTHLLDVPSSDRHTVKPWFNGKLDFAPDVKDFAAQGFPLVGGRLDYLDGRPVAALVYQRRQHIINVFTWPSVQVGGAGSFERNGYHAVHWTSKRMTYWAVSDLASPELRQFADLYSHS